MKKAQEPTNQSHFVSPEDVDRRMSTDGFPELQRLWDRFPRRDKQIDAIDPQTLGDREDRHMQAFFGWPRTVACLALLGSFALSYWAAPIPISYHGWPNPFLIAYAIGLAFLVLMAITCLQRYCVYPFDRLLAYRVDWLLAHRGYRNTFDSDQRTVRLQNQLCDLGIRDWDSFTYRATYKVHDGIVSQLSSVSANDCVLQGIRDFVGRKSEATRKFEPGRYFDHLVGGKATVSAFVKQFKETIDDLKGNVATREQMVDAIDALSDSVTTDSKGLAYLQELRRSVLADHFVPGNCFQAEVWQRDPWADLTHQDEFYSSAGLRGVQLLGRGPKGRLAPALYLDDPSLCCLDLRDSHKRLIRCRLIVSQVRDSLAGDPLVLLVDGVEGTNQVPPMVIHQAIIDYAKHCGFASVLYNATVHNRIPKRFVQHLSAGHELQAIRVQSLDTTRRQYLDAFSWPLEPMEYAYADGVVLVYGSETASTRHLPTWRAVHWLRMNVLNLIAALAVGGATASALLFQPKLVIALIAVTTPLIILHYRGQMRSEAD